MLRNAAHLLRRLPAWKGALAAAWPCAVGKASWRPTVGRRFLNTHKVHGLFINYIDHDGPHLFARPSSMSSPRVDAMLDFLRTDEDRGYRWLEDVLDHRNGLLLCDMGPSELCVCNPATQRRTLIPWAWRPVGGIYLAFDPAVSPHYEVLVIPAVPELEKPARRADEKGSNEKPPSLDDPPHVGEDNDTRRLMESEWPPTPWTLNMFSSKTSQWEEKIFVRQGQPAGTVRDMLVDRDEPTFGGPRQRYAVYSQGVFYVHCRGSFVLRLVLSNGTYQVIKTPAYNEEMRAVKPYLGRSEKGAYFGIVNKASQLLVWILTEYSSGQMEWILIHQDDLSHCGQHLRKCCSKMDAPWMVHDVPDTGHEDVDVATTLPKERFEWDSDNDDFFTTTFGADGDWPVYFDILGFHPYKEVIYLSADMFQVVAYHLSDSKIQYLGCSRPESYYHNGSNGIYESFVYIPRVVGELEKECDVAHVED